MDGEVSPYFDRVIGRAEHIRDLDVFESCRVDGDSKLIRWASGFEDFGKRFITKEDDGGTLYIVNRDDGTEASFAVTGYLRSYWLPSGKVSGRAMRALGSLHQRVVISGASSWFGLVAQTCTNIFDWVESRSPEGEFLPYQPVNGIDSEYPCFMASTPLLTSVKAGNTGESIAVPDFMKAYLDAAGTGRYRYTMSNEVSYSERIVGNSTGFTELEPKLFRHGHLVDVEVCFRGVRLRSGKRIFVKHLSSLTLLDRAASISLNKTMREERTKSEVAKVIEGAPRKRKYCFASKDTSSTIVVKESVIQRERSQDWNGSMRDLYVNADVNLLQSHIVPVVVEGFCEDDMEL